MKKINKFGKGCVSYYYSDKNSGYNRNTINITKSQSTKYGIGLLVIPIYTDDTIKKGNGWRAQTNKIYKVISEPRIAKIPSYSNGGIIRDMEVSVEIIAQTADMINLGKFTKKETFTKGFSGRTMMQGNTFLYENDKRTTSTINHTGLYNTFKSLLAYMTFNK